MTIGGAVAQLKELIDNEWINPIVQPAVKKVIETIKIELQAEPETNADRIRAMTDEELAEFLEKVSDGCDSCPMLKECTYSDEEISEKQIRLKWLKQEVEE